MTVNNNEYSNDLKKDTIKQELKKQELKKSKFRHDDVVILINDKNSSYYIINAIYKTKNCFDYLILEDQIEGFGCLECRVSKEKLKKAENFPCKTIYSSTDEQIYLSLDED